MSCSRRLGLALLIGGSMACRQLPSIQAGVCGNGVIDTGETCDGFGQGEARCRPPGAAAQCHLDCSVRTDGTRAACPRGWGCASDDVCRKATGNYRVEGEPIAGNAFSVMAGDFDGDGRGDVVAEEPSGTLGSTKFRIHYFDREAHLTQTWASPLSLIALTVAQVSTDGHADVVCTDGRLGVLHGQSDRTLLSQTYPSYALPETKVRIAGPLQRETVQDTSPLVVLTDRGDGMLSLARPDVSTLTLKVVVQVPGSIGQLAGELVLGDVFEDPVQYPCLDLALAQRGERQVSLYGFCERDALTGEVRYSDPKVSTVPLDPPASIDRGPLLADVDGDGHLDLLVGARLDTDSNDGDDRLYVAFGDGRSLASAQPFSAQVEDQAAASLAMPLAAGDFTGDLAADLIYPSGFLLSLRSTGARVPSYHSSSKRLGSAWTVARIADLNGNGMMDVVAGSRGNLDIDFFNGTNSHLMNPFVIPTMRPVEHMEVGDFDGDLVADVALSEIAAESEPSDVAVAYGNRAGAPAAPVTMARIAGIEQIGPLPYGDTATVDGLFILSSRLDAGGAHVGELAQLAPIGERAMICGVDLTSFASDGSLQSVPGLALTTGAFTGKDQQDTILLGANLSTGSYGMWLVPDLRNLRGQPQSLGWSFDPRVTPLTGLEPRAAMSRLGLTGPTQNPPAVALLLASGDLDRDGVDELVVAAPDSGTERCLVASADIVTGDLPQMVAHAPIALDAPCGQGSQLVVRDLDGDRAPDLVLLTGSRSGPRELLVLWNDGAGGFDADKRAAVPLRDDVPQAFVAFRPTKTAPEEFAYVTSSGLHLIAVSPRTRSFSHRQLELELKAATGVTATDLDGDGVTDLVVADAGRVRVLRAELEP